MTFKVLKFIMISDMMFFKRACSGIAGYMVSGTNMHSSFASQLDLKDHSIHSRSKMNC